MKFLLPLFFAILSQPSTLLAQLQLDYKMQLSQARNDGIQITFEPAYPFRSQLFMTLDPKLCYSPGTMTPLKNAADLYLVTVLNHSMDFSEVAQSYFDEFAPMDVEVCYMLVGRGRVEASGWGRRLPTWDPSQQSPARDIGMSASRNRADAVEIIMNPPLAYELSSLFVTPAEDKNCPEIGKEFNYEGRYYQVMSEAFNGRYYLDVKAPLGIELCYFLISRKTQKCLGNAIGFRVP